MDKNVKAVACNKLLQLHLTIMHQFQAISTILLYYGAYDHEMWGWINSEESNHDVEHVWNVMAHAQKPYLVFPRNGRVHLNWHWHQFSRLLAAKVCTSAVVMVVMLDTPFSEVKCKTTGYPLHLHVSPSLPLPCVTMCHQVSIEVYLKVTNKCCGLSVACLKGEN